MPDKLTGDSSWAVDRHVQTDQVLQLFDTKAATWSAKYAVAGQLAGRVDRFTTELDRCLPSGRKVLDLGCGTGNLAKRLASRGCSVTACYISEHMLREAVSSADGSTVVWMRLDPGWRTLPFASGSFDAVVASSLLEYVDNPEAVLRECARLLRSGGIVLCTVPNLTHPIRWLEWLARGATRLLWLRKVAHRWPPVEGYMVYLQISRHRHKSHWWSNAAHRASLCTIRPVDAGRHSALRLLAFGRTDDAEVAQ